MIILTRGLVTATFAIATAACMSDDMNGGMSGATTMSAVAPTTPSSSEPASPMPREAPPPAASSTQDPPTTGASAMSPSRNIVENVMSSADHTTLVEAAKAAGLVDTLSGPGPFTVFAPTDAAFEKLPDGTVESLVKPEMKAALQEVLAYHVVAGRVTADDISKAIESGGGKATLKTAEGGTLTASMMGARIMLTDEKGGMSHVTMGDVMQSNGVVHVVDTVLMPG